MRYAGITAYAYMNEAGEQRERSYAVDELGYLYASDVAVGQLPTWAKTLESVKPAIAVPPDSGTPFKRPS